MAWDSENLYIFDDYAGSGVWALSGATYGYGWQTIAPPASFAGSFGRRIFISGGPTNPGAGCFFSSDANPLDIWAGGDNAASVNSSNQFAVSWSAAGPWRGPFTAPWAPRVSAAYSLTADGRSIWVGGGLDFTSGAPTGVGFQDVWAFDASVCLLGSNGAPCSGHGTPDTAAVTCACQFAWSGDLFCGSCGPNVAGAACDACAAGFYGSSCSACTNCNGHGDCDGDGTQSGTGTCSCYSGWKGPTCSLPVVSQTPSPSFSSAPQPAPAAAAGSAPGLSGGAAFGVSLLVIVAAAAAAAWVFATYYGGGPTLLKWWGAVRSAAEAGASGVAKAVGSASARGGAGAGESERTPLTAATPRLTPTEAAQRLKPSPFAASSGPL